VIKQIHKILVHCLIHSLFLSQAFAHSDSNPPVDVMPGISNGVSQNRAGYGFLNSSSEADADALFSQECPRPDGAGNVTACIPPNTPLLAAYNLADRNLEAAFTNLAKEKAYEYQLVQRAALDPAAALPGQPACIANNPGLDNMRADLNDMKGKTDAQLNEHIRILGTVIRNLSAIAPASRTAEQLNRLEENKRKHLMAVKLRSMRAANDNNRMAQAMLLDRQLESAQGRTCAFNDDNSKRKCMSIRKNRDRIRSGFPTVFGASLSEIDGFTGNKEEIRNAIANADEKRLEASMYTAIGTPIVRCSTYPRNRFETSINLLIGYNGTPDPVPAAGSGAASGCTPSSQDQAALIRGRTTIGDAFSTDDGYPNIVSNDLNAGRPKGKFSDAFKAGTDSLANPLDTASDSRMARAMGDFNTAATEMKTLQFLNTSSNIAVLCGDMNLSKLANKFPQVIRQTVLDQNNPGSRDALHRLLCQKGIMRDFQRDDQTLDCRGVSGVPNVDPGMTVRRTKFGFPFANDMNYSITQKPDGSYEVGSKINYVFRYDPTIDPSNTATGLEGYRGDPHVPVTERKTKAQQQADFEAKTAQWVARSTTFFNQMSAGVSNPRVTFKIERCTGCPDTTTPRIQVAPCYRRVAPDNFATLYPGQTFEPYRCYYNNGSRNVTDWQDAGGFTTNMDDSTIMHETGHNLGLSDEYVADYYPAHPTGEDGNSINESGGVNCNSTMANNHVACHNLYPRHLLEIVRPARACTP